MPFGNEKPASGVQISRHWIMTASLVIIAICVGGAALIRMRDILTPLLIAIFIYFLIQPVIEYLFRLRLPPWLLYPFIIALPLLFALGVVWIVDFNIRAFALRLPTYRQSLFDTLNTVGPYLGVEPQARPKPPTVPLSNVQPLPDPDSSAAPSTPDTPDPVSEALPSEQPPDISAAVEPAASERPPGEVPITAPTQLTDEEILRGEAYDWESYLTEYFDRSREGLIGSAVGITMHIVEVTVLVVFYLLFIFLEARKLRGRVEAGFESDTAKRIIEVLDKIDESIRRYLWIKTGVSVGLGASTTVLGWMFGLDFALLWGVLMFVANYITYVGSIAALVPPIAIAFVQLNPWVAIVLTILLVLNRLFWIDFAEIKYSGEHLDVSPLLLLLSIAMLGWIWGVVGMLLAVPLVTSTKIVLSHFDNTRYIARLMSDD
jgi:predicted PurR-regulated permease PerM